MSLVQPGKLCRQLKRSKDEGSEKIVMGGLGPRQY